MRMLQSLAVLLPIACALPAAAMPPNPAGMAESASQPRSAGEIEQGGSRDRDRPTTSQSAVPQSGSMIEGAERLRAGQFLWTPDAAPEGPLLVVVSLATQRAAVYRNGVPIGISTVSSGRSGYPTPTGEFTVLERDAVHFSNRYDNAPMPHMLRLTWDGIALHGGDVPNHPASHGCIRLPRKFARLLFAEARIGTTVIVTDEAIEPGVVPAEALLGAR